jgi:hypothetical protein
MTTCFLRIERLSLADGARVTRAIACGAAQDRLYLNRRVD